MYTDTHLHLNKEYYEDIETVIKEAHENNVKRLIISSYNRSSIEEAIELAESHENIYMTLGFHPEVADDITKEDIKWLKAKVKHQKCLAIGEIGLDYYWRKDNKEKQKELFRECLNIAKESKKPVVIHSRDAFKDTVDILSEYQLNGIIHCFSGSVENAIIYNKLGYLLGIGGVLTFKNSNLHEVIKEVSLDKIVIETDSPFLSPEPYRGKQNGPKNIPIIGKKIAETKGIKEEEVMNITENNIIKLFNIM